MGNATRDVIRESEEIMSTKVLVTGAAGFIGSHVARHCLELGMTVVGTDDLSGGFTENVPSGCTFVRGDLKSRSFVHSLWADHGPFEYVYHLGAYAAEGLSHFIRSYNYQTNLVASMNLINEAVNYGCARFVFTSSIAVYGRNQLPMVESLVPQPEDPYGISKYAVELDLKAAHEMFGMDYVIFRPHNVYGEQQNIADRYRNVIGIFMNQLLQGEPMTVFGDGTQTRAFSYIDDVAPVIARSPLVKAAKNEVFNVGADTPYTIMQLAGEIASAMGRSLRVRHLADRNEVVHAFSDHSKARAVFGDTPATELRAGIRKMAAWVSSRGPASPVTFGDIEIEKNLPASWKLASSTQVVR
jgi:UDP-glucose 4-epimerase